MEETWFYLVSVLSFISAFLLLYNQKKSRKNRPPSPLSLPIIGHLHLIKEPLHRVLQQLSYKYGPIFSLRFGSRPVVIISSPSAVEECFTKNDVVLANRPFLMVGKHLNYNNRTIGTAPYGPLWRNLRRVTALEFFSTTRLNSYLGIRSDEVRSLIKNLHRECLGQSFTKVEMSSRLQDLSFNSLMRIISGKRYYGADVEDVGEATKFKNVMRENFELSGSSRPGDYLPFLRWIDFQGLEKRMVKLKVKADAFSQGLIDEHRNKTEGGNTYDTLIDHMLAVQQSEPEQYTDDIIKGIILTLLLAGTDTSSVTLEWAMSLLLNHPNVLEKARAEVDKHIGESLLVEEADLPKLQFLQSIINETMRLFPAAPLLLPHVPSADCTIGGFNISRDTIVLVNAWAIHRDPSVWEDPTSFRPERFENGGGIEGHKFIPFGMGRRQCPGAGLAHRVMGLALATLVQCFEWERVSEELVDMSEGKGLTMPKNIPLEAMCRPREQMINVLLEL